MRSGIVYAGAVVHDRGVVARVGDDEALVLDRAALGGLADEAVAPVRSRPSDVGVRAAEAGAERDLEAGVVERAGAAPGGDGGRRARRQDAGRALGRLGDRAGRGRAGADRERVDVGALMGAAERERVAGGGERADGDGAAGRPARQRAAALGGLAHRGDARAGAVDDRDRRDVDVRRRAGEREREAGVARRRPRCTVPAKPGIALIAAATLPLLTARPPAPSTAEVSPPICTWNDCVAPAEAGQHDLLLLVAALERVRDPGGRVVLAADDRHGLAAVVDERERVARRRSR